MRTIIEYAAITIVGIGMALFVANYAGDFITEYFAIINQAFDALK